MRPLVRLLCVIINIRLIADDAEYTFVYTEDEGFHQISDYDTWMKVSDNNFSRTDTWIDNIFYSIYEFKERGFLKAQREQNNSYIEFENISLGED